MKKGLAFWFLWLGANWGAPPCMAQRALILDYQLRPASYADALMNRLSRIGFTVDHRRFYPLLTRGDLRDYRAVVLLDAAGPGGSGLRPSRAELKALITYVEGGGVLILGLPSHPEGFKLLPVYNRLFKRLGAGIEALPFFPKGGAGGYDSTLLPYVYFHPSTAAIDAAGLDRDVVLDRGPVLDVRPPAIPLAVSSPDAYAVAAIDDKKPARPPIPSGYAVIAAAPVGKGAVLAAGHLILNAGGYTGATSFQPLTSDDWVRPTDRFMVAALDAAFSMAAGSRNATIATTPALHLASRALPAAHPRECGLVSVAARQAATPDAARIDAELKQARARIRRRIYGRWLDQGVRLGWTEADHDDAWLKNLADLSRRAGLNVLWAVGSPEALLPGAAPAPRQESLLRSWDALSAALEGSTVSWLVGLNYPGIPFSDKSYERSRGPDGKERQTISPFNEIIWEKRLIPELELVARYSAAHRSVAGATLDLEMYGYDALGYPQSAAFEDGAYRAFLRDGALPAATLQKAARVSCRKRFAWLRDEGLLGAYYASLERASESLGRRVRERVRAINPDFAFAVYLFGMSDHWFYQGFARGLSTPEDPVLWMSFQGRSKRDLWRLSRDGCYLLHAAPLILGGHPTAEYADVVAASRRWHDGYWINHLTKLIDRSPDPDDIESPKSSTHDAWQAIEKANADSR